MTTTISFADWVDWLAIKLTAARLYESAPHSLKHEMKATVRRLAEGIGEDEIEAFTSQIPNFGRAMDSFSPEEQRRFNRQFASSVTEVSLHWASIFADRD